MSFTHLAWSLTGSMLRPMTLVLRLSNSGLSFAMYPSSVVHTGVKSFGCEKRIAHLSPIQSWNRMVPSVVSAVKSGASSPIRTGMFDLHCIEGSGCPARREGRGVLQILGLRPLAGRLGDVDYIAVPGGHQRLGG